MKIFTILVISLILTWQKSQAATYSLRNPKAWATHDLSAQDQKVLRNASSILLTDLIANGVVKIGNLDLKTLAREIDQVTYAGVTLGFLVAQGRAGHLYDVTKKKVFVNLDYLEGSDGSTPIVLLHETLGSLGYMDDHYEISSSIGAIHRLVKIPCASSRSLAACLKGPNQLEIQKIASEFKFDLSHRNLNPSQVENSREFDGLQLAGGTSEGGGGGDPVSALTKAMMLERLIRQKESISFINFANQIVDLETYRSSSNCPQNTRQEFEQKVHIEQAHGRLQFTFPDSCSYDLVQNGFSYWFIDGFIDTVRKLFESRDP